MSSEKDVMLKYVACGLCGIAFGIAAEKGRVHEPGMIRGQMDFSYYVMMKMFLGATTSGLACLGLLSLGPDKFRVKLYDARAAFAACMREKGLVSSVVGGALLGAGMTIAGTCPGMVMVQVGAQTHNALYTLAGGLMGALLYGVLEPVVRQLVRPSGLARQERLDDGRSYASTALPLAAVMGCAVAGLEMYRPWTTEVSTSWGGSLWTTRSWPPYVAGALIGALQIPLVLTVRDSLGGSSAYCTVVSQALVTSRLRRALPYLANFKDGVANWWQVFYVSGAVLGGYLSAQASGSLGYSSPVSQSQALLGGVLIIFGSRLAGGCTSGHGLSGMAMLMLNSYIAVAAMFAGGMATSWAMRQGLI